MKKWAPRRGVSVAMAVAVGLALTGCVQFGDYFGGESEERCTQRASALGRYLHDAYGLKSATIESAGTGSAGQCTVKGTVTILSTSTAQDVVDAAVSLVEAVEESGYETAETDLVLVVGDERLMVLPQMPRG